MTNITTQTIRVDLSTDKVIPSAFTHQNDTARTLVFDMYNGGMPYTMTGNTVKFAYKSPIVNGQYSVIAGASMASGTVSGNKVSVTLPVAYTQISGVGMLTMIITPTSGTVRPVNIRLVVQKSADGDDTVLNASDWPDGLYEYMDNWLEENEPTEIANIKSDLSDISENKPNLYTTSLLQIGKNWTGGTAADRAVAYVPVKPNTSYLVIAPTNQNISTITVIEKAANTGSSGNLHSTYITSGTDQVITSTANTNYFCLQFGGTTTLSQSDFDNYDVYVCEGQRAVYSAVDKVARQDIDTLESSIERYGNLVNFDDVQIGVNYTGATAANRAVLYFKVEPNTEYFIDNPSNAALSNYIYIIEKAEGKGSSPPIAIKTIYVEKTTLTTSSTTKYICVQFSGVSTVTSADFENYNLYICKGSEESFTAVDKVARKAESFESFYELAEEKPKGVSRFGGYELRNTTDNLKVVNHWQDAHTAAPYFSVNATLREYSSINYNRNPQNKNILNNLRQEEIDFTPQDDGFTRIVVGKNSDDVFFVAYVASNRKGAFGDAKYDALEVTSDFVNFRTILRSDALSSGDGIPVPNMTNIKVDHVKEFSDGNYLVAIRAHNISDNNDYTHFYRMSHDFAEINHCTYEDFNGNEKQMVDEFGSSVYDWSVFIAGEKALATTYGNRNPQTDYGRVWYTENSGYSWKQVFQTNNHFQDGQASGVTVSQAHTHGVMIDIINSETTRLFVLVGEDNSNIFWTDKGMNATDSDWNVIDIRNQPFYNFQSFTQVVNGYPFKDGLVFGSDNEGVGCVYRINKLDDGSYSKIEAAHEFLPNKWNGTYYCAAEMSRRDFGSPLLMCETHENCRLTEADNELLNEYHKARVVATYDGINFTEIWTDDTYGSHDVFIDGAIASRNFSYCSRGMNCWLLKNGDAVIKYVGRDYLYFGGNPMFSVTGISDASCKVRWIKNADKYL